MLYEVKNRFTGKVQLTAEIGCSKYAAPSVKLGLAVKWAVKVGARLVGARLDGAILDSARLVGASLVGASLVGASLVGARLDGASGVIDGGTPNGWRCVGWLREGWLSVRVGCHDKRVKEGRKYWADKEDRREVLAALKYVESVARLRGWALEPSKKDSA